MADACAFANLHGALYCAGADACSECELPLPAAPAILPMPAHVVICDDCFTPLLDISYTQEDRCPYSLHHSCYRELRTARCPHCGLYLLDFADDEQRTAIQDLVSAAKDGNAHLLAQRLTAGINPNSVDAAGTPALVLSSAHGHLLCALLLLHTGAEIDQLTEDGLSPLHMAVIRGHSSLAQVRRSFAFWEQIPRTDTVCCLHRHVATTPPRC
eukprot:m.52438 g.52438  ORF g.52438 m.52438 type:complete len:213 (-) comp6694_c0_seq2:1089-1727(-)